MQSREKSRLLSKFMFEETNSPDLDGFHGSLPSEP